MQIIAVFSISLLRNILDCTKRFLSTTAEDISFLNKLMKKAEKEHYSKSEFNNKCT